MKKHSAFYILHSSFPTAFTLIELIIVIAILAVAAGITVHYLVSAGQLYTLLAAQGQADSEIAGAVSRMRNEARLHVQTLAADSNTWTFANRLNVTNTFRQSGTDFNLNGNRLAGGVQRSGFSYYDATNGPLIPLPLATADCSRISRVALDFKATNELASSERTVNFFLQKDLLK